MVPRRKIRGATTRELGSNKRKIQQGLQQCYPLTKNTNKIPTCTTTRTHKMGNGGRKKEEQHATNKRAQIQKRLQQLDTKLIHDKRKSSWQNTYKDGKTTAKNKEQTDKEKQHTNPDAANTEQYEQAPEKHYGTMREKRYKNIETQNEEEEKSYIRKSYNAKQ